MLAPGGRVGCGGSIEGRGSRVRRPSRHQKRKRPQVLPQRGGACRKQSDRPRGDGGGESRQKGPWSAQVDTGTGSCVDWIPRHANHSRGESKERDPTREMGWAVVKVKERQQEEASAYPSEQLGVTSSLGARHGFDGRASNCRWYGVGGVAAGLVMSRCRRWPCYLGEMDGRFLQRTRPPLFEIRVAIGDGGTLIADVQNPNEAQAKPVRGWLDR